MRLLLAICVNMIIKKEMRIDLNRPIMPVVKNIGS